MALFWSKNVFFSREVWYRWSIYQMKALCRVKSEKLLIVTICLVKCRKNGKTRKFWASLTFWLKFQPYLGLPRMRYWNMRWVRIRTWLYVETSPYPSIPEKLLTGWLTGSLVFRRLWRHRDSYWVEFWLIRINSYNDVISWTFCDDSLVMSHSIGSRLSKT